MNTNPLHTNYKGRIIKSGDEVLVYRNLNTTTVRNDWNKRDIDLFKGKDNVLWSLRNKKGQVAHHAYGVVLKNVTFKVIQGSGIKPSKNNPNKMTAAYGRLGVLETKQKNVHAFIKGELVSIKHEMELVKNNLVDITYNPFKYESFVLRSNEKEICGAEMVWMYEQQIGDKIVPMVKVFNPILK